MNNYYSFLFAYYYWYNNYYFSYHRKLSLLNFDLQNLRNNKPKFTTDERLKRKGLRTLNELVYGDKVAYTKALGGAFKSVRLENPSQNPKFYWINSTRKLLNNEWSIRDKTKGMLVYIVIEFMCSKVVKAADGTSEIVYFKNWYHSKQRQILSGSELSWTYFK